MVEERRGVARRRAWFAMLDICCLNPYEQRGVGRCGPGRACVTVSNKRDGEGGGVRRGAGIDGGADWRARRGRVPLQVGKEAFKGGDCRRRVRPVGASAL